MTKRISKILIINICVILLCGCWDYRDINNRSITLSVGIDIVDDNIQFTGEIAKLASSPKESKEEAKTADVYKILSYGKDFEQTRINYDTINPYPTFLGATRVVVFGQAFAREGIEPYLNRIDKFPDYRKTLLAVVSRDPPKELFDIGTEKDISVGFLIEDIMYHLKQRGMGLYTNIGDILSDIAMENVGYLLPYIGIEHDSIKYLGLAVMKDSRLTGVIDIKDTEGILYVMAEKPRLTEVITGMEDENEEESKKNSYSFKTNVKKRKITTDYQNEKVIVNIDMDVSAVLEYQYYIKKISDEKVKLLENRISEKIKKDIMENITRSQKEFKCDIFMFAKYFRGSHPNIYKELNWTEAYTHADINVNVKTKIINFSLLDPNAEKKY